MRGSWRPNRTATYCPPPTLMAISLSLPFSRVAQHWGLGAQPLWVLVSLQHHFSNSLIPNSLNFLCIELYNSSTSTQSLPITGHRNMYFRCLWNGMFDRYRAEITVTQYTGHSLPVHQFWLYRGIFTQSHIVSQARPFQWNMHFHRLWNGMFGRVGGQHTKVSQLFNVARHARSFKLWSKPT